MPRRSARPRRRPLAGAAALLALAQALLPHPARAATLTVGPGRQYATVAGAVAAAVDGDVVQVQAGTYLSDYTYVLKDISIVGVGGLARLVAQAEIPNRKAILVTNGDITLENIEFANARVPDLNGAGIRYEGGNLTIRDCYFHDNENGILAASVPTGRIQISRSEFARNGRGNGYTHGLYVGQVASLRVTGSYFHDNPVGHHIKSRALRTIVTGNRIVDGPQGASSYNVDVPNGGVALISRNVIVQSATSPNFAVLHYGGEGVAYAGSSLRVVDNTILNFRTPAVGLLNHTAVIARVARNRLYQLPTPVLGPGTQAGNVALAAPVAVSTSSPWAD